MIFFFFCEEGLQNNAFLHVLGREQHWSNLHQSLILVATFSSVSQPCHLPCFVAATQQEPVKMCVLAWPVL